MFILINIDNSGFVSYYWCYCIICVSKNFNFKLYDCSIIWK